jgi:hypothetical protein
MVDRLDRDPNFLINIMFSDEATFHVSGAANRHNVRIWGSQQLHCVIEHVREPESERLVWRHVQHDHQTWVFFFSPRRRLSQVAHTWTCCSSTPFLSWSTCSQMSFSTRRCFTQLVARCAASSECNISRPLDRTRWTNGLASTFP